MINFSNEDYKAAQHMISELESVSNKLSSWESRFLESVSDDLVNYRRLTEKQMEKLTEIYEAKTA